MFVKKEDTCLRRLRSILRQPLGRCSVRGSQVIMGPFRLGQLK